MQTFTWTGLDKRGIRIKGETVSKNANLVKADLRKQGINPQVVKPKAKPLFGASGKKITGRDIAVFSRQLATMMKSGVPVFDVREDMEYAASHAKGARHLGSRRQERNDTL
jgi:type IV pilus assembly protein PilC